ncbi:conserved unknown protein [Ectocarpus siliculosus]|uniref:PPM-type phosphatase domain-containing protein n=1 Tax=Ectocarpus siliculosus TaxID=2880 RepID=D7G8E8_ECTSI|nr:conserved unknown protein [Ectocarpus siliculosus]|eukprot:CBJ27993.1 conserved unknown protein [Ectocarpus siliculosus]
MVRLEGRWASAGSTEPNVGIYSIAGEKAHDPLWKNQDAGLVIAPFDRREGQALFAIFDGHGKNGGQASRECMERLPKHLASASSQSGSPASALRRSCQRLHHDLATGVAGDCGRSGTTLCAAVLAGRRLTVANVGDSGCLRLSRSTAAASSGSSASPSAAAAAIPGKAALASDRGTPDVVDKAGGARGGGTSNRRRLRTAEKLIAGAAAGEEAAPGGGSRGGGLVTERLSRDHKPESKGELERIRAAGGIVFPLPRSGSGGGSGAGGVTGGAPPTAEGSKKGLKTAARGIAAGIPRVWTASGDGPGLAMSRSIGDKMAHSVGVTYEPEITEFDLDKRSDVMLVFASDGVWDVLSAEDIRKVRAFKPLRVRRNVFNEVLLLFVSQRGKRYRLQHESRCTHRSKHGSIHGGSGG